MNESINFNNKNPAGIIWANVMKNIHKNLEKAEFERPFIVQKATICPFSGKLSNSNCINEYTEYFVRGTVPQETCNIH